MEKDGISQEEIDEIEQEMFKEESESEEDLDSVFTEDEVTKEEEITPLPKTTLQKGSDSYRVIVPKNIIHELELEKGDELEWEKDSTNTIKIYAVRNGE